MATTAAAMLLYRPQASRPRSARRRLAARFRYRRSGSVGMASGASPHNPSPSPCAFLRTPRLRPALRDQSHSLRAAGSVPVYAAGSLTRHARRILRHRLHPARQSPRSPRPRTPRRLLRTERSSRRSRSPQPAISLRHPGALMIPPTVDDQTFRGRIIQGEVHDENCSVLGGVSGHAGLFSNALDVLRYASCIISNGGKLIQPDAPLKRTRLFTPATIQLFASRQSPPADSSRALGWDTPSGESSSGRHFGRRSIGHLGYTGTSLWIDLERKLAITSCLPIAPGRTAQHRRFAPSGPSFTTLSSML